MTNPSSLKNLNAEMREIFERSKNDREIIVGSEVRSILVALGDALGRIAQLEREDGLQLKLRPTSTVTGLVAELGKDIQARVWEGTDGHGTKVVAFIARIAVSEDEPPATHERFLKELQETPKPRAADVWPGRMIP